MISSVVNILLYLDGVINDLTNNIYKLFNFLASLNLFGNKIYQDIVNRIYVILGMVMLFVLAYSLLRAVINPDDFAKGETSFPKLIQNIVISIVIIAVLPTIFTLAFNIQNSLLNQGTIPKIILGTDKDNLNSSSGVEITYYAYQAFLHINEEKCLPENAYDTNGNIAWTSDEVDKAIDECSTSINTNASNVKWYKPWRLLNSTVTFKDVDSEIEKGNISFTNYNQFGESVVSGDLTYIFVISTIASIFILYVLANFCFDMALRVVKLMFYQIIAPIPVVCRAIPFNGLKDVFNKWMKNTINTFLEVFIRLAVMYLGVYMIQIIGEATEFKSLPGLLGLIAKALVIMSIVAFIRQAPKLIGDLFGIDSGSMKLGLMDKLAQGGGLFAATAVGGGVGTAVKNFARTEGGFRKRVKSAVGGLASGTIRGMNQGRTAKNFADVKKGVTTAQTNAENARIKRIERGQRYQAKGVGTVRGHMQDFGNTVNKFLYGDVLEKYEKRIKQAQDFDIRDKAREWVNTNDEVTKVANQEFKDHDAKKQTKAEILADERKRLESLIEQGTATDSDKKLLQHLNDTNDPLHEIAENAVYDRERAKWWTKHEELKKKYETARDAAIDKYAKIEGSEIRRMIDEANLIYQVHGGDELFKNEDIRDKNKIKRIGAIDINRAASSMKDNHNLITGHDENDEVYVYQYEIDASGKKVVKLDERGMPELVRDAEGNAIKESIRDSFGGFKQTPEHDITGTIEKLRGSDEYNTALKNQRAQEESSKK